MQKRHRQSLKNRNNFPQLKKKNRSRIKIVGDIQVKGYIIQLPVPSNKIGGDGVKDYEEVLEERRKRINKPRQVIKDEYVEDDFFSIDDDDDLDFPEDWK